MRTLTIDELTHVPGGVTENECVGAFTLGGAAIGFFAGGGGAGADLGAALGGGIGLMLCGSIVNPRATVMQK